MTMNQRIIEAVKDTDLTCWPWDVYQASQDDLLSAYLVFNYETVPETFGANDVPYDKYLIQLHLFTPRSTDTVSLRKSIKKMIHQAGFTRPSEENASDSDGQHYVFEFEAIEWNGDE